MNTWKKEKKKKKKNTKLFNREMESYCNIFFGKKNINNAKYCFA